MNDDGKLEINERQRELLLQGLRYVRSSIALAVEEPTENSVKKRRNDIQEVETLQSIVKQFTTAAVARVS